MIKAPIAKKIRHTTHINGIDIHDDYTWMRDSKWPDEVSQPEIIDYLEQENKYADHFFNNSSDLSSKIFDELKGRIKLDDQSIPVKKDEYYYYNRTEKDKNYPIYCRKYQSMEGREEILLDMNIIATGKDFVSLDSVAISPDHKLLAYSIDFQGDEKYSIRILDINQGTILEDKIENSAGNIIWHRTKPAFFYSSVGKDRRISSVLFHQLGSSNDELIMHEPNQLYQIDICQSSSLGYLFINKVGHDSDEWYYVDIDSNITEPTLVIKRCDRVRYEISHHGDFFYISINDISENFRLMRAPISNLTYNSWQEYISAQDKKYLKGFDFTKDYLVLNYKVDGLDRIIVRNINNGAENYISFPDEAYQAKATSTNFEENDIRISYSSLARPLTTYLYDFDKNSLTILKTQEIPSGFNSGEYTVERIFAKSCGAMVPISLLYKKTLFKADGSNPLYLYGYGSYGINIPPSFNSEAITLADRGFIYAIAHIRGGDDMGFGWYEEAKFLNKKLTFEDFIAATQHLIREKYTKAGNIVIHGRSAGGMLMGAVINQCPELYKAAIANVPFVDVLNTMLDETLPLTTGEFKEWGNPKEPEYFDYIQSYSPYDNIKKQDYPSILVTAGISDPRVGYWEPAKWVAKLRDVKTDQNLILFKTNMTSGHMRASGRFDYLREEAEHCTFILKIWGLK